MADPVLAGLRAIHVLGAVIWAGATIVLAVYHEYVIDPGDPRRTIERMAAYDAMSTKIGASGVISVLAGLALYWIVSDGLNPDWITTSYGMAITVGALAGLAAIGVGIPLVGFTNNRSVDFYDEVKARDELTPDQADTVEALHSRLRLGERVVAVLLTIAVVAMAIAQYI